MTDSTTTTTPPAAPMWERIAKRMNPFIVGVLRSPFHGMFSNHLLILSVRGRRSGTLYHVPVEYHQDGNLLTIVSNTRRTWWKNLIGGADAMLHLRGFDVHAIGSVIVDHQAVTKAIEAAYRMPHARAEKFAKDKVVLQLRLSALPANYAL